MIKYLKLLLDIFVRLAILFVEFFLIFIVYSRFHSSNAFFNISLLSLLVIIALINSTAVYFIWIKYVRNNNPIE